MREQFSFVYIKFFFVCFEWFYLLCTVFASSLHLHFIHWEKNKSDLECVMRGHCFGTCMFRPRQISPFYPVTSRTLFWSRAFCVYIRESKVARKNSPEQRAWERCSRPFQGIQLSMSDAHPEHSPGLPRHWHFQPENTVRLHFVPWGLAYNENAKVRTTCVCFLREEICEIARLDLACLVTPIMHLKYSREETKVRLYIFFSKKEQWQ